MFSTVYPVYEIDSNNTIVKATTVAENPGNCKCSKTIWKLKWKFDWKWPTVWWLLYSKGSQKFKSDCFLQKFSLLDQIFKILRNLSEMSDSDLCIEEIQKSYLKVAYLEIFKKKNCLSFPSNVQLALSFKKFQEIFRNFCKSHLFFFLTTLPTELEFMPNI